MDTNNWRTTAAQSVDPSAETGDDWRTHLPPHLRPKLIIYLMRSLRRIFPFFVQEGQEELNKIAMLFEEKICIAAMSRSDYLEKVLLMRVILDVTPENTFPDSGNNNWLPDTGESHNMQPQVHNQGQRRPMPMSANQSQAHEQILSQNIRSNMGSSGVQSFASLTSALPPVSGLSRTFILDFVARNPTMQNISEALQSSEVNSMGQGVHSNINSRQRQMAGRSQVALQHLKQVRNFLQYLYQQLSNHKYFHQEAIHQQKVIMMQQLMAQEPNATNMMNSLPMLQQQQFNRQAKQQLPAQMQAHQMPQVDQRDDVDEPDVFQQHISRGQHALNTHQQMKSGASFPICSPQSSQSLQAASPHLAEHSSPNIDQQNLLTFFSKDETPLQSGTANSPFIFSSPSSEHSSRTANSPFIFSSPSSEHSSRTANSPFIFSSPSTPLAPSPVPGDSEIVPYELFPNTQQLNQPEMQQKLMKQKMLQQQQEKMVHSPFHASSPSTPLAPSPVPGDFEIVPYELFPNSLQLNPPEMQQKLMKQKMLQQQQEQMVHSPFHASSPSTPLAPSPVPGDFEIVPYELFPNSLQLNPPEMQQKLMKQKMLQQQQEQMVHSPFHVSSPSAPLAPSPVPGDSEIVPYELFPNILQLNPLEMQQKLLKQKMLQQQQEQMVHSPFHVSSPSTPLAPSPMPGDSEIVPYELFPNTQQLNQPEMQKKLMKQKMLQKQQEEMVHSPFHVSSPSTPLAPSPVPGDSEIVPYELFPNTQQLNQPEMQQKLMKQKMLQQQQEQMVHSPFHASSPSTPLAPSSVPGDSEIALYELFPNSQQLNQPEMQKKLMKQKMLQPQQEEMVHSPFHFSSPSTPLAPSPVPGDSEIALYELLPNSQQLNPPQMQQKLTKQKMLQQQQEEMVHSPFHVSSPSTPLAPSRVPGDSEIALYELFPNSLQLNQPEMPQKLMKQKMLQQEQEQMVHSPFQVSSPSTPLAPAPVPGDSETALYELFPLSNAKPD